jgi:hypothetical protein
MTPLGVGLLLFALLIAVAFATLWFIKARENSVLRKSVDTAMMLASKASLAQKQLEQYGPIENAKRELFELRKAVDRRMGEAAEREQAVAELQERALKETEAERKRVVREALAEAQQEAKAAREKAKAALEAVKQSEERAIAIIKDAVNRAEEIVKSADRRADEIAGQAMVAVRDERRLKAAAEAMQRVIDGYGDAYIKPAASLLDELAEQYAFKGAGLELKRARKASADLVAAGGAARCDYVENNRREAAEDFVASAFNGRVDAILSRVKSDNYGTLEKEIVDAFELVNPREPFKDARVTHAYRDARIAELKWACAVQELKRIDMEEQRAIRERIRDEERARREQEREIKKAAEEARKIEQERERVMREMAAANEADKAKFETMLAEMSERLRLAEERGQRAKSMAELTKKGTVYIISNIGAFGEGVYKIGLTRRQDPLERIDELGDASVPFPFDVHAMIEAEDAPALEHALHNHFVLDRVNKVNHRKEFFKVDIARLREDIASLGLSASWTIAAEAREFRETKKIEEMIAKDPKVRESWVKRQLVLEEMEERLGAEEEEAVVSA